MPVIVIVFLCGAIAWFIKTLLGWEFLVFFIFYLVLSWLFSKIFKD